MGGGGKGGDGGAGQARADEKQRQLRVRQGTRRVNGIFDSQFDDGFYKDRQDAYMNYAQPQLQDQHQDAQEQLGYSLARSGLLDSSVRADKSSDLAKLYAINSQKVRDDARASGTQARTAVEDARGNLMTTLSATGDAQGAANSAIARAGALSEAPAYSPLGQMFSVFTNGLGTQIAAERAAALGGPQPAVNSGLFGTPSGAVKVSR